MIVGNLEVFICAAKRTVLCGIARSLNGVKHGWRLYCRKLFYIIFTGDSRHMCLQPHVPFPSSPMPLALQTASLKWIASQHPQRSPRSTLLSWHEEFLQPCLLSQRPSRLHKVVHSSEYRVLDLLETLPRSLQIARCIIVQSLRMLMDIQFVLLPTHVLPLNEILPQDLRHALCMLNSLRCFYGS